MTPIAPSQRFDRFKIEWLLIRDLIPHPKVQRPYNEAHAKKIADAFDPDKFRPLDVIPAPRAEKFYVFAGQHRLGAARLALGEDQRLPCHVHDAETTTKHQAEICLGVDNMLNWKPIDRWKVRLLALEEIPVKIDALLTRRGLTVRQMTGKKIVRAVAALEDVYVKHGGEAALDRVLRVLHGAFGDDKDAYDGLLIKGLGLLLHRLGDRIADETLVDKLARHSGPGRLIGLARDHAKINEVSLPWSMAEKMLQAYNVGQRATGRLSFAHQTTERK